MSAIYRTHRHISLHNMHTNARNHQASDLMDRGVHGQRAVGVGHGRIIILSRWITAIIVGLFMIRQQRFLLFSSSRQSQRLLHVHLAIASVGILLGHAGSRSWPRAFHADMCRWQSPLAVPIIAIVPIGVVDGVLAVVAVVAVVSRRLKEGGRHGRFTRFADLGRRQRITIHDKPLEVADGLLQWMASGRR